MEMEKSVAWKYLEKIWLTVDYVYTLSSASLPLYQNLCLFTFAIYV